LSLAVLLLAVVLLAGCDGGSDRPERLLDGQAAQEFSPVPGSVIALGRVLDGTTLGGRFTSCRPAGAGVRNDAVVVERIGVFGESLTFADSGRKTLYGCDGGTDAAGERKPPWCGNPAGLLFGGKLLDPRLDVLCRDPKGRPLAYAWVEPPRARGGSASTRTRTPRFTKCSRGYRCGLPLPAGSSRAERVRPST
jgi:hypothetical protein